MKKYPKPKRFDHNLIVIGAGSAGLVAAYIAAAVKAKVTLIEKDKMGGDCLHTGCVPSKALIRSAKYMSHIRRANEFGFKSANAEFDFADIMRRVQGVIQKIEPHDSVERYEQLGVECIQGQARIITPYSVEVNGQTLTARSIVIATGAGPLIPPIKNIDTIEYLTSDTVWMLETLPEKLLVLGGGPIGCELTQCFARLGSQVTQIEMTPRILSIEDEAISQRLMQRFSEEGIDVRTNHKATEVRIQEGRKLLICEYQGQDVSIEFDQLLVAVGRKANTKGYGLEELGVATRDDGTVEVNEYLQTNYPSLYACGDVTGPFQFTHAASHQAWFCSVNALFGLFKKFRVDYSVIPWTTFTDPEIASVGLNEQRANDKGIAYELTEFDIGDLDRAIAEQEAYGVVRVLTKPGKDAILGVTIMGDHAGETLAEFVLAMKHGLGLNKILGAIHTYPTLAEANKFAAGIWKKAHAPAGLLRWVKRFHTWRRG